METTDKDMTKNQEKLQDWFHMTSGTKPCLNFTNSIKINSKQVYLWCTFENVKLNPVVDQIKNRIAQTQ